MAKLGLAAPTAAPTRTKPLSEAEQVEGALNRFYAELEKMSFVSSASYAEVGLSVIFDDVIRLRAMLSRIDTLMSKGHRLLAKMKGVLAAQTALLEDETDKLRVHPERLVAKGFAYTERDAFYRSDPALIPTRVRIRELERIVSDCQTFVTVVTAKYRLFEGARNDQLLMMSLIKLGYSMHELTEDDKRRGMA